MQRENGFTLVEILVAVTITSLLLFTVYGVFTSVSSAKQRLEAGGESQHQARVLLDRLGRELRSAYFLRSDPQTRFVGGMTDEEIPFIELTTTAVTPHGGKPTGISVLRYELRPDPEPEPALNAEAGAERKVLLRQEYPPFTPADALPEPYRMGTGYEDLRFRFHNGSEWQEQWDGRTQGVPRMIEATVTVLSDGRPLVYATAFEVPRL